MVHLFSKLARFAVLRKCHYGLDTQTPGKQMSDFLPIVLQQPQLECNMQFPVIYLISRKLTVKCVSLARRTRRFMQSYWDAGDQVIGTSAMQWHCAIINSHYYYRLHEGLLHNQIIDLTKWLLRVRIVSIIDPHSPIKICKATARIALMSPYNLWPTATIILQQLHYDICPSLYH